MKKIKSQSAEDKILDLILIVRGERVMIDSDLAEIYGVTTKQLNRAVKRNLERFPRDFMFQLNEKEKEFLISNYLHLGQLKYSPYLPYVFTEYGAVMAANILNTPVAIQTSILVVRVFVSVKQAVTMNKELANKIEKLQHNFGKRLDGHSKDIEILLEAIRQLMNPPNPPRKKIGFRIGQEKNI